MSVRRISESSSTSRLMRKSVPAARARRLDSRPSSCGEALGNYPASWNAIWFFPARFARYIAASAKGTSSAGL